MKTSFPTRQVMSRDSPERSVSSTREDFVRDGDIASPGFEIEPSSATDPMERQAAGSLWRFVLGIDTQKRLLSAAEVAALGDPFTQKVLLQGVEPKTLRELIDAVAAIDNPKYSDRRMFLVAEGAQARLLDDRFEFNGRLVVVWQGADSVAPDMMLSTVPVADDPRSLLQLAAWSETTRSFHFFERDRKSSRWMWAGHSFHALKAPSRGRGPFDSHINGSLVMKELKEPWNHWNSSAASIPPEAIPRDSELITDPLFASIRSADELEPIVRTAIRRWTTSRFDADTDGGNLNSLRDYLRQVLWCTSVNLVSSTRVIGQPVEGVYPLPSSFFYDFDALAFLGDNIDESQRLLPVGRFEVDAALYENGVAAFGLAVGDDSDAKRSVKGDTHFAFLVPERAFEDLAVLRELVDREAVDARTALCLLFVDFSNPVFSPRRGALLAYAIDSVALGHGGMDFKSKFVARVRQSSHGPESPEAEFLDLVDDPDILARCRAALDALDAALRQKLSTKEGVAEILALADSRRFAFADRRSLAEFRSTMAFGPNPIKHLAMGGDGSVFLKSDDSGEGEI